MGWLGPTLLIAVVFLIAIAAAAGGFWASVVTQRKKSRARGPFLVGVVCGVVVGTALAARRRGLNAVGASTLTALLRPVQAGSNHAAGGVASMIVRTITGGAVGRRRPTPPPKQRFRPLSRSGSTSC